MVASPLVGAARSESGAPGVAARDHQRRSGFSTRVDGKRRGVCFGPVESTLRACRSGDGTPGVARFGKRGHTHGEFRGFVALRPRCGAHHPGAAVQSVHAVLEGVPRFPVSTQPGARSSRIATARLLAVVASLERTRAPAAGLLYWYALYPAHQFVFAGMLRKITCTARSRQSLATIVTG